LPFDLNGDGDVDLVMAWTKRTPFYKGRSIQFLVNNGDGTFRDDTSERLPQTDNFDQLVYDLVAGDLNDDGATDIAFDLGATFADPSHSLVPVFLVNHANTFTVLPTATFAEPPYGQLRLIDTDGDGRTEVVSAWASPSGDELFAVSARSS
jgi:hypothetical protein